MTKFLVYNARKRQKGGDSAAQYFARTECVAGVQDMRFQALMPDALHWLGITKIDRFVSMSNMKHDAIVDASMKLEEITLFSHLVARPESELDLLRAVLLVAEPEDGRGGSP